MKQTEKHHYILFNPLTGRKLFFPPTEPFLQYKDDINDPYFWQQANARSINAEYRKSQSEVQRKSQNYPKIEWDFIW